MAGGEVLANIILNGEDEAAAGFDEIGDSMEESGGSAQLLSGRLSGLADQLSDTIMPARMAGSSIDEAGDEAAEAGAQAATGAAGFEAMDDSSSGLSTRMLGLSGSIGTVAVAVGGLIATLSPLLAMVSALAVGAAGLATAFGAIVGTGILAFNEKKKKQNKKQLKQVEQKIQRLEELKEQNDGLSKSQQEQLENLKEQRKKLEETSKGMGGLKSAIEDVVGEIKPMVVEFGQRFVPLIEAALDALPDLVRSVLDAVGPLDTFKSALKDLGGFAASAIPKLVEYLVEMGRKTLPALRSVANWITGSLVPALQGFVSWGVDLMEMLAGAKGSINRILGAFEQLRRTLDLAEGAGNRAKSSIADLAVSFGQLLTSGIVRVVDTVASAVQWFRELPEPIRNTALVLGGLAAAALAPVSILGSLSAAVGWLIAPLSSLVGVFGSVLAIINPVTIAIGALAAAFTTDFMGIRSTVLEIADALKNRFLKTVTRLRQVAAPIIRQIASAWQGQGSRILSVAEGLAQTIREVLAPMQELGGVGQSTLPTLAGLWDRHGGAILSTIQLISTNLSEGLISAMAAASAALEGDFLQMESMIAQFKGAMLNIWRPLWATVQRTVHNAIPAVRRAVGRVTGAVRGALSTAWSWVRTRGVELAKGALSFLAAQAINAFAFGKNNLLPAVITAVQSAWLWVRTRGVSIAQTALKTLGREALAAFSFGAGAAGSGGGALLSEVTSAVQRAWEWVRTRGVTLAEGALAFLSRVAAEAFEFARSEIVPAVRSGLAKAWTWLRGTAPGLAQSAVSRLVSAALTAWEFTRENVVSPIKTGLGKVWTWLRETAPGAAKEAFSFLSDKGKEAFAFAKSDLLPKVRDGLGGVWTWVRGPGKEKATGAIEFLSTKGKEAFAFAKSDLVPELQGGIQGLDEWLRTTGKAKLSSALESVLKRYPEITRKAGDAVNRFMQVSGDKWVSTISNYAAVLTSTFKAIPRGLRQVYNQLLKPNMARMQEFWRSHKDEIGLIVGALVAVVSEAYRHLTVFVTRTLDMLGRAWKKWGDEILAVGRFSFSTLVSVVEGALDLLAGTIKVAMAAIEGDWGEAWDLITGGVRDAFYEMNSFLKKWGGKLVNYMGVLIGDIIQWWVDLAHELIGNSIIPEMIADITSAFTNWNIVETIGSILSSVFDEFSSLVTDVVGEGGEIPSLISDVTSAFTDWTIVETVTGILSSVFDGFASLVTDVVGGEGEIPTLISDITTAFTDWSIVETVSGILESVLDEFSSLVTDVVGESGEIPSLLSKTTKKVEGWVSGFTKPFKNATDTVKGKFSDLKETVVGNSTVPDMLDDLVSHAEGSWSSKFIGPFKQAANSIESRLGSLKNQLAGALNGGGGGKPDWAKGLGKKQRRLINTAFEKVRITNNAGEVLGLGDLSTKARAAKALRDDVEGLQEAVHQASPHVDPPGGIKNVSGPLAVHELASGGQLLSDGLFYGHAGELVTPAAEVDRSPSATAPAAAGGAADIDEEALGEAIADNMDINQEIILDAVFDRGATTDSILDEIDDRRTRQTGSSS